MARLTLDELAQAHGTDKGMHHHGYTRWYERHFAHLVDRKPTVLEIGILDGSSLRMWRDYFGDGARIVGVDVDTSVCERAREQGFEVHQGDQSDRSFMRGVGEIVRPDVVVDDGSHLAPHQIASFESLFTFVKDGGAYVIEDVHCSFWAPYGNVFPFLYGLLNSVNNHGKSLPARAIVDPAFRFSDELTATCTAMHFYSGLVIIDKERKDRS